MEVIDQLVDFFEHHTQLGRRYQFRKIFDEFQRTLAQELDYQREAANMTALAANLQEFQRIQVPLPINDYIIAGELALDGRVRGP